VWCKKSRDCILNQTVKVVSEVNVYDLSIGLFVVKQSFGVSHADADVDDDSRLETECQMG
jgi:hypothetical protein